MGGKEKGGGAWHRQYIQLAKAGMVDIFGCHLRFKLIDIITLVVSLYKFMRCDEYIQSKLLQFTKCSKSISIYE